MRGRFDQLSHFFQGLIGAATICAALSTPSIAADVTLVGTVGYSSDYSTFAILTADGIRNGSSSGTSGALRLELWASPQPFTGSFASSYRMAYYAVGAVVAGATTGKITGIVPFVVPPGGTWNVAMVLTEYAGATTNDGYVERGYLDFTQTVFFPGAPPPPPDTTPPTVSITSPTGGAVSGVVTVSANASDNVGVTRVDFYVNGALAGTDSAAPFQYSWNTTSVANGTATLRAIAYDAAGNSGPSSLVSVTVANAPPPDTTPPTASITSPTSGSVSGTVTVSANASDNVGVTRVDFYVNGALVGSDSAAPYQYSWNTTSVVNGTATLKAIAYDAAGNSGPSSLVSVTVANGPPPDTIPPTVRIVSPAAGKVAGSITITAEASDNVGVVRVDFYVNGSLIASDRTPPWQASWNTTKAADRSINVVAVAYDAAGNSGTSVSVQMEVFNPGSPPAPVDSTAPTAAVASPTGGSVAGVVPVMINASDDVGVVRVDLFANGHIVASRTAAPWQFAWNSAVVANGAVQLQAVAYDAAGNAGTSPSVTVTVANAGPPSTQATAYAVEYYNATLDHYFMTATQSDMDVLDAGLIGGWLRTGYAFKVYAQPVPGASAVCRIYIPPPYGDSHFFSASPTECAEAVEQNPSFVDETADAFEIDTPDASGNCPAGDAPVYRLWNHRSDINHRYTTSWDIRQQMVAQGYVAEGYGPNAVMMCSPP